MTVSIKNKKLPLFYADTKYQLQNLETLWINLVIFYSGYICAFTMTGDTQLKEIETFQANICILS